LRPLDGFSRAPVRFRARDSQEASLTDRHAAPVSPPATRDNEEKGMKLRRAPVLAAAGAMLAAALIVVIPNAFATPPTGFADTVVASATLPVGLDFTPDGRMLVTTKPGQLYAYSKTGVRTLALDASGFTCAGQPGQDERGMLSVAVDPAFTTNNFIYVYY